MCKGHYSLQNPEEEEILEDEDDDEEEIEQEIQTGTKKGKEFVVVGLT